MPRTSQIVGRLIQIVAITSIPSCFSSFGSGITSISPDRYFISKNAPAEYQLLIGKYGVKEMAYFPDFADHVGHKEAKSIVRQNVVNEIRDLAKLPLPKESRLTGGADYCRYSGGFHAKEGQASCYKIIDNKVEKRWFHEYACGSYVPLPSCDIRISTDPSFTSDYQQASDLSHELMAESYHEVFTFVVMVIAFTFPLWLFLGGWIAKKK